MIKQGHAWGGIWLAAMLVMVVPQSAQAARSASSTLTAFHVESGVYSFSIYARQTSASPDSDVVVGTSQFFVEYNHLALANPTLSNINPRYTGPGPSSPYQPMEVALVAAPDGVPRLVVTIRRGSGPGAILSSDLPNGELICTVSLTITDSSQTANVRWDSTNSAITSATDEHVANSFVGTHNGPLPVQLATFTARIINEQGHVRLDWRTLSEVNNYGFYVQASPMHIGGFGTLSELIPGYGTTYEPHDYTWTDTMPAPGRRFYRLKQVDLDGTPHFSEPIQPIGLTDAAMPTLPTEIVLGQNYPNPFNPTTRIEFALPRTVHVRIEVFSLLGQRVATLLDGVRAAGYHAVEYRMDDAAGAASGVYLYRMMVDGSVRATRKMVLIR